MGRYQPSGRLWNDNPGAKSQGIKQLMAGGGIVIVAQTVIPQLTSLFS